MSRSLVELYEEQGQEDPGSYPFGLLPTRKGMVESLKSGRSNDVVILGNDLPCAIAAQLLALNGVRVLLLTPGPLTPLGAASIIDTLEVSRIPLLQALRCIPSIIKSTRVLSRFAPHRLIPSLNTEIAPNPSYGSKLFARAGVPPVFDDGAIVAEALLAARRDGAFVLPYSEVLFLEMVGESGIRILGIRDRLSGDTFEVRSGGVVVGHGVAIPGSRLRGTSESRTSVSGDYIAQFEVVPDTQKKLGLSLLSRGVPLQWCTVKSGLEAIVFRRPSGGYVLTTQIPHFEGAREKAIEEIQQAVGEVVGTVITPRASFASGSELILGKGVMRIPSSSPLIACGIANKLAYLYARSAGKVLNDVVTAENLTNPGKLRSLRTGALPPIDSFRRDAAQANVTDLAIELAIARWGDRVRYIGDFKDGFSMIGEKVLRGELGIAVLADQVFHVDDLPHTVMKYHAENPQERERIQGEIVALQEEASLHIGRGARKII